MVKLKEEEKKQMLQEKNTLDQAEKKEARNKSDKNKAAKDKIAEGSPLTKTATLHDLDVLLYPLVTEKAVNMIEAENKVTFVVDDRAGKSEVKKAVEEAYGVKVIKINVVRDMKGRKKAIVKLDKKNKASELATKLGVL